jgi:hypothetical protein
MVKDSKRFADSGGWGYAVFDYDAKSDTFKPGTPRATRRRATTPSAGSRATPQAKARDYVLRSTGSGKDSRAGESRF